MGGEIPEELISRPVLFEGLTDVWRAFWALNGRRLYSEGIPGSIPLSELKVYLELFGADFKFFDMGDTKEREEFFLLFAALDDEFMGIQLQKLKEKHDRRLDKTRN